MKREIYLDNSATTKIDGLVLEEMARVAAESYGNPSSLHHKGIQGERILNAARKEMAGLLGVDEKEVIFTSGGTESNNLAIIGIARRYRKRGNHLLTTAIEHSSVLEPFQMLEKEGFEVTCLAPDSGGLIDPDAVRQAIRPETILVSIMHVNNETGALQPVARIANLLKKEKKAPFFHVDAVQAFGKVPLPPGLQGIDALCVSAHKLHGPRGAGALFLKEGVMLEPLFSGGGQERGLRPGTENTPGIAGMALAARQSFAGMKEKAAQLYEMKKQFINSLEQKHPWIRINGPRDEEEESAPHIINISFPGLKGEIIVHALEGHGIYVSTGSACHSREKRVSHVLQAMGLNKEELEGAIRFSFSRNTEQEEIAYAAEKISETVAGLKNFHENISR